MTNRKDGLVISLLGVGLCCRTVCADTLLVPSPAYPTIQSAIDGASNGDQIVVAPGTYPETITFDGKAIILRSSEGPNATIIDGTGLNDSVVKCVSGEGSDTILEGFTITGGAGDSTTGSRRGGGMYIFQSNPTVMNCTFEGNTAWRGGGLSLFQSQAIINGCLFKENTAEFGGGCYLENSDSTIENCTFVENVADGGGGLTSVRGAPTVSGCIFNNNQAIETFPVIFGTGGGVLLVFGAPTLVGCLFSSNSAVDGGAIFNRETAPKIDGCDFIRNNSAVGGGAIASELSNVTIEGSRLERNRAGLWGGGIESIVGVLTVERSTFVYNNAGEGGGAISTFFTNEGAVRNSVFQNNSAHSQGGALDIRNDSDVAIAHCTFHENHAPLGAAVALGDPDWLSKPSTMTVSNSILWNNGEEVWNNDGSSVSISYSTVQGGFSGDGNLATFPRFFGVGDLRLLPSSLCINAGDPNFVLQVDETDKDGNPRLQGCRTDIGAYESLIQQVFGDFDGSRVIDLKDFAAFQLCIGSVASNSAWVDACVCAFDASGDKAVDVADYASFYDHFGEGRQPPPKIDRLVPAPGEWIVNATGLTRIQIGFTEEILIPRDAIEVWRVGSGTVTNFTTVYDNDSNILTVEFASPIQDDRVTLVVDYVVTGLTGTELDGEIADPLDASLPSGNDVPGGQGVFRINVLQGDANRDGVVGAADLELITASFGLCNGDPGFDPLADVSGDACVDEQDEAISLAATGRELPVTDGTAPSVIETIWQEGLAPGSIDNVSLVLSEPYVFTMHPNSCFAVDGAGHITVALVTTSIFGGDVGCLFIPALPSCDGIVINLSNAVSDVSGELLESPFSEPCP